MWIFGYFPDFIIWIVMNVYLLIDVFTVLVYAWNNNGPAYTIGSAYKNLYDWWAVFFFPVRKWVLYNCLTPLKIIT